MLGRATPDVLHHLFRESPNDRANHRRPGAIPPDIEHPGRSTANTRGPGTLQRLNRRRLEPLSPKLRR